MIFGTDHKKKVFLQLGFIIIDKLKLHKNYITVNSTSTSAPGNYEVWRKWMDNFRYIICEGVLPSWHIWMVAFAIYLILWSIHYYINKQTNFENLCHEKRSLRKLVFGKQFTVWCLLQGWPWDIGVSWWLFSWDIEVS